MLHEGNARTTLFNWLLARDQRGTLVLRGEDADVVRSTRASHDGIKDDLRCPGLQWAEGPDVAGPYRPYRQSERMDRYRAAADRLLTEERAYYCFCGAEQFEKERAAALSAGLPPRYSGR